MVKSNAKTPKHIYSDIVDILFRVGNEYMVAKKANHRSIHYSMIEWLGNFYFFIFLSKVVLSSLHLVLHQRLTYGLVGFNHLLMQVANQLHFYLVK